MKNFINNFENIMAAAAFAEAGEFETAREILREKGRTLTVPAENKPDINKLAQSF